MVGAPDIIHKKMLSRGTNPKRICMGLGWVGGGYKCQLPARSLLLPVKISKRVKITPKRRTTLTPNGKQILSIYLVHMPSWLLRG